MHTPSHHEPDLRILARLETIEKAALFAAAAIAGGVLLMWHFPALAALAPVSWSGMRAVTATGILIAVVSLTFSAPRQSTLAVRIGTVAGLVVLFVPVIVLLTYAGFRPFFPQVWPILRPPPETAAALAIAAISLPFIRHSKGVLSGIADASAVFFAAFVLFLLGSLLFRGYEFVAVDRSTLATPQTILCLGLLAFIILGRRAAEGGLPAMLVSTGIGSQIARKVLPGIIAMPFVAFGLLEYLDRTDLVAIAYGRSAMGPAVVLAALGVMGWMGRHANTLEHRLRQQSLTDELTGVLNRRGFETVAEYVIRNAERSGTRLIAFFFDLDGLKRANDHLGHEAGSLVIQRFADLLVVTFRKSDVVARIGGDEFVILAPGLPESANDILARLTRVVDVCNASGLVPSPISYSVGHAELPPEGGRLEDLVAEADARMYAEKSRKRAA